MGSGCCGSKESSRGAPALQNIQRQKTLLDTIDTSKGTSGNLLNMRVNEFGEAKIILLGCDGAGKTAMYQKLCDIDKPLKPTGGFNTKKIKYDGEFEIDLWEIGGAKALRPKWNMIFKKVDGIVFCVDSSDISEIVKYEEVKQCFQDYVLNAEQLESIPIMILATKMDQPGASKNLGTTQSLMNLNKKKERPVVFSSTQLDQVNVTVFAPLLEKIMAEKQVKK